MVIPRVYQMMSLLEGNTRSEDQGKRNELLFAFLIIATLAAEPVDFWYSPFEGVPSTQTVMLGDCTLRFTDMVLVI